MTPPNNSAKPMKSAEEWAENQNHPFDDYVMESNVGLILDFIRAIQADALASRGDDPRLLPELPEDYHLVSINDIPYEDGTFDYRADIIKSGDSWLLSGEGPTPRAAVLAAMERIK